MALPAGDSPLFVSTMRQASPTTLIVEFDTSEQCPIDFQGDSADIVYLISFAHAERYGADHPLARAASLLKRQLRLNLAPLLTFADARAESPEEEQALEGLWQPSEPLARCAQQVAQAIGSNAELQLLTGDFPELPDRLRELAAMAAWAAERGARIRLSYIL